MVLSASSPFVDFSTVMAGVGLKNPKSTVMLPLVSAALSASSVPESPPASVGSVPPLSVTVPEV